MCNRSFGALKRRARRAGSRSWLANVLTALACVVVGLNCMVRAAGAGAVTADDWGAFVPQVGLVGAALMYNPYYRGGPEQDGQTASGEIYDPEGWTAAIQLDLRGRFGGVRFGLNYKPSYALIECLGKRIILKINDVGPLRPGRIIDFNVRAMRYCDPSLDLGVLYDVSVTPLEGEEWTAGPVFATPGIVVAAEETMGDLQ